MLQNAREDLPRVKLIPRFRRLVRGVLVVGCLAILEVLAADESASTEPRRVIVLGFSGADPRRVQQYMDEGHLPNLRALAARGTFSTLETTNPAETSVAWAALSVGAHPGKTAVFDRVRRSPGSYRLENSLDRREMIPTPVWVYRMPLVVGMGFSMLPLLIVLLARTLIASRSGIMLPHYWYWLPPLVLGLMAGSSTYVFIKRFVPAESPRTLLAREGTPFWQSAGEHGVCCSILHVPTTYPAVAFPEGRILAELGTPDARQTWGTPAVYATRLEGRERGHEPDNGEPQLDRVFGARRVLLVPEPGREHEFRTFIHGPGSCSTAAGTAPSMGPQAPPQTLTITRHPDSDRATFQSAGAAVSARAGEWTEWLPVVYSPENPILRFRGLVRFRVRSVSPEFYAYATPVNYHPGEAPLSIPLSAPAGFSREITQRTQTLHESVGGAIGTKALMDGLITEDEFLEALRFSFENRWRIVASELEKQDWRVLMGVFLAVDRVQHMFTRYVDPRHPFHESTAPERFRSAIRSAYQEMDRIVGETMTKHVDSRTDLWVLSEHGFASFRKEVDLNSWLVAAGFLTLKDPSPAAGDRPASAESPIDWGRTTAYSLGTGMIYLNRAGREPEGIVPMTVAADPVLEALRKGLLDLRDPDTGERVVREVYRRDDLYPGPHVGSAAELIVGFEEGYRSSWDSAAGRIAPPVVRMNRNKWSGDHAGVDPSLVPGFLVTNQKVEVESPTVLDIAPTILRAVGVSPPTTMEGRPLLKR